ncbi:E3 SUMO-protein ligase ZBED1-like [Xyrichtys novacula]|nr:E3 SUMO-protein ligase ZBED1-like [Xyrichtys novacula]
MLIVTSAVEPHFKALLFLSDEERNNNFSRLQTEVVVELSDEDDDDDGEAEAGMKPPLPKKSKESSTSESLLGEDYRPKIKGGGPQQTRAEKAEDKIKRYRAVRPAGLQDNPLAWWRANEKEHPFLAHKVIPPCPRDQLVSERVFSSAGDLSPQKGAAST